MSAGRLMRVARFSLIALAYFIGAAPAWSTPILQDKGIYVAGPFAVPDITKPPGASEEAVFLAGSTQHAPLFLNELVINESGGQFSNNGWVSNSAFNISVTNGGNAVWISWDLSNTSYALTYVSVNFDNNFYHVYGTRPRFTSEGAIQVTGNQRDIISHIHFFGVTSVPEAGTTSIMLLLSLTGLEFFRRSLRRPCAS